MLLGKASEAARRDSGAWLRGSMSKLDKGRNVSGQIGKTGAYVNHGCWADQWVSKAFCSVLVQYISSWAVMGSPKGCGN